MVIQYASRPDTQNRQLEELVKKSYDAIGVRMEGQNDKFPELLKLEKQCKLFSREAAWIADYPDGDNFMQLFYGPNSYQSNNACATIPEYDALYRKSVRMPAGPERDRLYQEMTRMLEGYAPHVLTVSRYRNQLDPGPRVEGYRKHPILTSHVAVRRRRSEQQLNSGGEATVPGDPGRLTSGRAVRRTAAGRHRDRPRVARSRGSAAPRRRAAANEAPPARDPRGPAWEK